MSNVKPIAYLAVGNVLEFYDFALYGFLAPIIAQLYFPHDDPVISYISYFSTFALGFLARPLGAFVYGYVGDKRGRKAALTHSLMLMGMATFALGCIPPFHQIGYMAPMLLSMCRFVQGFCMGGEFSGSLVVAAEQMPLGRSLQGATRMGFIGAAGVLGWFVGLLVTYVCTLGWLQEFAWRIPFFIGGITALLGYRMRQNMPDSPKWPETKAPRTSYPFFSLWQESLAVMGIGCFTNVMFYGQFIFLNTFLPLATGISQPLAFLVTSVGIGSYMVMLPVMGKIADQYGHIPVMLFATGLTALLSYPLYLLLMSRNPSLLCVAEWTSGTLVAAFMAPAMYIMPKLFSPKVRYTGVSLNYNLGATLFGGTAPAILMALYKTTGHPLTPSLYLIGGSIYGIIATLICKNILRKIQ